MRIAVTGTHLVGKSTLVEWMEERLPEYRVVDEPYLLLEEEGYEFASPPCLEDFVEQLRCSLALLEEEDSRNVLFDRCPLDFLGYLLAHEDSASFDLEEWLGRVRPALQTLDLVVFVPIEERDRIQVPSHEEPEMRQAVDEKLAWLLLSDPFDLGVEVLSVHGSRAARASQVLERLAEALRRRSPAP